MELVSAYAPFANGGTGVWPHGIAEIRDSDGKVVFRRAGSGAGQVISPELAGTMNDMLSAVIGHGTGRSAALPRPAAGKTGTTQDYRDAWFIGYTADLVAGVWLGNDDNSPMQQGDRRLIAGADLAPPHARRDPGDAGASPAERPQGSGGSSAAGSERIIRQILRAVPPCPSPPPSPRKRGG